MFKFELGILAKDKVTGFMGTITGRAEYLYGNNTYGITRPSNDGEKIIEEWITEDRVEEVELPKAGSGE